MKMKVKWGAGESDVIWDMRSDGKFSYYQATSFFHEAYGGKNYYQSKSGKSGAGTLERADSLVKLNPYRTDVSELEFSSADEIIPQTRLVKVFAPLTKKCLNQEAPFVLSDGHRILFTTGSRLSHDILNFDEHESDLDNIRKQISIEVEWFDLYGNATTNAYILTIKENAQIGVDALRFADLRAPVDATYAGKSDSDIYVSQDTFFQGALGIIQVERMGEKTFWLHVNEFGYYDKRWDEDPSTAKGEIVDGWHGEGDGLFWKRKGMSVACFIEQHTEGDTVEYEEDFSAVEFFYLGITKVREQMEENLACKVASIRANSDMDKITKEKLAEFPKETLITVTDAEAAGCCAPGIDRFIEEFEIPVDGVTIGQLFNHPRIVEMLQNDDFRRTVAMKIRKYEENNE